MMKGGGGGEWRLSTPWEILLLLYILQRFLYCEIGDLVWSSSGRLIETSFARGLLLLLLYSTTNNKKGKLFIHLLTHPTFSHGFEAQPTTPPPHPLAPQTQPDHQGKHPRRHPSLHPEHPLRSHRGRPPDLEKADDEAARGAREIDPRRHLAARLGVGIKIVSVQGDRDDHGAEHVQSPGQGDEHVVVGVLHGEADEH